jgi:protein ImuB
LACARLELQLRLEPEGHHQRSIRLPAPTREAKTLLTLIRLDLEGTPPGAPVTGFTLTAHPDRPREAQLSLFGPLALSPDRLATTLARLFALLGSGRFGSPRAVDGHRPESSTLVEYNPPSPPTEPPGSPPGRGLLAVRVLRPPVPLEVITASPGDDSDRVAPKQILSLVQEGTTQHPRIQGAIRVASGPWSLEDEWWTGRAVERDYWDIELSQGGLYRIFRQRSTGEWYADGIYD